LVAGAERHVGTAGSVGLPRLIMKGRWTWKVFVDCFDVALGLIGDVIAGIPDLG